MLVSIFSLIKPAFNTAVHVACLVWLFHSLVLDRWHEKNNCGFAQDKSLLSPACSTEPRGNQSSWTTERNEVVQRACKHVTPAHTATCMAIKLTHRKWTRSGACGALKYKSLERRGGKSAVCAAATIITRHCWIGIHQAVEGSFPTW